MYPMPVAEDHLAIRSFPFGKWDTMAAESIMCTWKRQLALHLFSGRKSSNEPKLKLNFLNWAEGGRLEGKGQRIEDRGGKLKAEGGRWEVGEKLRHLESLNVNGMEHNARTAANL